MHLYITSRPSLSPAIILSVRLVLGTDCISSQGQRLCAQRKMFNIKEANSMAVVETPTFTVEAVNLQRAVTGKWRAVPVVPGVSTF
jgi:hypothetical protein